MRRRKLVPHPHVYSSSCILHRSGVSSRPMNVYQMRMDLESREEIAFVADQIRDSYGKLFFRGARTGSTMRLRLPSPLHMLDIFLTFNKY